MRIDIQLHCAACGHQVTDMPRFQLVSSDCSRCGHQMEVRTVRSEMTNAEAIEYVLSQHKDVHACIAALDAEIAALEQSEQYELIGDWQAAKAAIEKSEVPGDRITAWVNDPRNQAWRDKNHF